MKAIRILIVDDHVLFRDSLARLLDSKGDISVVGVCSTVPDALESISQSVPDVVLLDYDLGGESGLGLLAKVKSSPTQMRVLIVTAGLSDQMVVRVMESGAAGIFLKHCSPDQLLTAIQLVANGEIWLDNIALPALITGNRRRLEVMELAKPLTRRQSQVLHGILIGRANKEIAWELHTSESAVKAVIQELFNKAGVRTRSQLVRVAIEKRWTDWIQG